MYVELVEGDIKSNRGRIVSIETVGLAARSVESYISLFPFDKSILGYVELNKTIKGYKGQHACLYICIDIDNEDDKEASRNSAIRVVNRLNTLYGIPPEDLFIYYSGNKGFHVYLCDRLLGIQNQYFDEIGAKCKSFISENFADIPHIDTVIYEDHRLIRIPNSKHSKTCLYKIEITFQELNSDLTGILEKAKEPRSLNRIKVYSDIVRNDRLHDDFMSFFHGIKIVDNRVNDGTFWGAMEKGERNEGYFKQACALFTYSELSEQSILEIIQSINAGSSTPLEKHELKLIVRSANRTKRMQIDNDLRLYTFKDAIPLWLDSIKPEKNRISLGFDAFDNVMKGKLRGKVCDVIGYGGSKKSLFSQYVAYCNIVKFQRVLYSTMEMGIPDLMARAINMAVEPERFSASYELEQLDVYDHETVLKFLDETVNNNFTDRFLMTDSASMTCEKYDKLISDITNRIGNIDILIVDGLGMMGGAEKEVDRYSVASKELKELAKKWNIFVMLICHISKGEERSSKDLSKAVRGSEKIVDNCDFYISMAQHRMDGDDGLPDFNNRFGNARLVNKRGNGIVLDQFFELNSGTLRFKETVEIEQSTKKRYV